MKPVLKRLGTYDRRARILRLLRFSWGYKGPGFTRCLTLALMPVFAHFHREYNGWHIILAGVRLHYKTSPCGSLAA